MQKIDFILEEDESSTDVRANAFAYKLTVKNLGNEAIHLLSLQQRIPSDVTSVEVENPTSVALKAQCQKICKELEFIVNNNLLTFFEQIKNRIVQSNIEIMNKVLESQGNALFSLFKIMWKIASGSYKTSLERQIYKMNAYSVKIENSHQAKRAFNDWYKDIPDEEKTFFNSKLEELLQIEKKIGDDEIRSKSLATIESGSFFSQTYVFIFSRNKWEPKLYNISIEGTFASKNLENQFAESASTSLTITPDPVRLTLFAIFSSFMGAVVKYCIDVKNVSLKFPYSFERIANSLDNQITINFFLNALIGAIIALVFFNIYERIDIGKKINVGVGWRSALLIGVLCGLLGERIVSALEALII
jgi:uncharacterized membrane protein YeaQ/YmgE (transglycosylase-associated protein family)